MKTMAILLMIFTFIPVFLNANPGKSNWDDSKLNTAAQSNFLSPLEKEIVFEMNKLRSNPARYAAEYIAPLSKNYKQKLLYYPGDKPLMTREGVIALNECVTELKRQKPLPLLYPNAGLSKAARDHVKDQSRTGQTGHRGSDRSNARTRIEHYGYWKVRMAENIAYGGRTAQQIVIYLLIDDGVRDRGHRKNFLNPDFQVVGVATGSHPEYKTMSVMDFAGGFSEK